MKTTEEAKKMFNEYQKEMAAVSSDLKIEIQNDRKQEIQEKYLEPIIGMVGQLRKEAEDMAGLRSLYSDPKRMLAIQAVNKTDAISPGDLALIQTLDGLPGDMLSTVAAHATKPGVQLALLNAASKDAEIRKTILDRVALPTADIKNVAVNEKEILETLFHAPDIIRRNVPEKLAIGHRIKDLEKILTD